MLYAQYVSSAIIDLNMTTPTLLGPGLIARNLDVAPKDVVYVKGISLASDGLCCIFSDGGGKLVLISPEDRVADLEELVRDLVNELGCDAT